MRPQAVRTAGGLRARLYHTRLRKRGTAFVPAIHLLIQPTEVGGGATFQGGAATGRR